MRWLVNYIRQVFCKHDFEIEEMYIEYDSFRHGEMKGIKRQLFCKKCCYHTNHWKYL